MVAATGGWFIAPGDGSSSWHRSISAAFVQLPSSSVGRDCEQALLREPCSAQLRARARAYVSLSLSFLLSAQTLPPAAEDKARRPTQPGGESLPAVALEPASAFTSTIECPAGATNAGQSPHAPTHRLLPGRDPTVVFALSFSTGQQFGALDSALKCKCSFGESRPAESALIVLQSLTSLLAFRLCDKKKVAHDQPASDVDNSAARVMPDHESKRGRVGACEERRPQRARGSTTLCAGSVACACSRGGGRPLSWLTVMISKGPTLAPLPALDARKTHSHGPARSTTSTSLLAPERCRLPLIPRRCDSSDDATRLVWRGSAAGSASPRRSVCPPAAPPSLYLLRSLLSCRQDISIGRSCVLLLQPRLDAIPSARADTPVSCLPPPSLARLPLDQLPFSSLPSYLTFRALAAWLDVRFDLIARRPSHSTCASCRPPGPPSCSCFWPARPPLPSRSTTGSLLSPPVARLSEEVSRLGRPRVAGPREQALLRPSGRQL